MWKRTIRIIKKCRLTIRSFFRPVKGYITLQEIIRRKGIVYREICPGKISHFSSAITPKKQSRSIFKERSTRTTPGYVVIIPDGMVTSYYGYVLLRDKKRLRLFEEVSRCYHYRPFHEHYCHGFVKRKVIRNRKRVNGVVVVLTMTAAPHNYYHWLIECVSRLKLLETLNISVDFYLVPHVLPYQRQVLEALMIPHGKILHTEENVLVQADKLVVPALPFQKDVYFKDTGEFTIVIDVADWAIEFLREKFLPEKQNISSGKKIYISRQKASNRKILNEEELIQCVQKYGFDIVHLEGMSFKEQVTLFNNSRTVLGYHGAGFANLVFCSHATKIVEIFSDSYFPNFYWALSNKVGLSYYYFMAESVVGSEQRFDIVVNIEELQKFLNHIKI